MHNSVERGLDFAWQPLVAELVQPEQERHLPSVHALIFAALAAALLGAAAILPLDRPPLSLFPCPLKAATGWPCLFCGCTHAFAYAVRGELWQALVASPLGTLLALLCAAHVGLTLARLVGLRWSFPMLTLSIRARAAALVLLAANWAFVAARSKGAL